MPTLGHPARQPAPNAQPLRLPGGRLSQPLHACTMTATLLRCIAAALHVLASGACRLLQRTCILLQVCPCDAKALGPLSSLHLQAPAASTITGAALSARRSAGVQSDPSRPFQEHQRTRHPGTCVTPAQPLLSRTPPARAVPHAALHMRPLSQATGGVSGMRWGSPSPVAAQRLVILTDLVPLGQVRIEVLLAVKL